MIFGLILLAVGIIAMLVKLGVLSGSVWSYTWPAILIIFGLYFAFGRMFWRRSRRWWGWYPRDDRDSDKKQ